MTVVCRACKARIVWARTENGKPIPLDADLDPDGNIATYRHGGRLVAVIVPPDALARLEDDARLLYHSHFATCPYADQFRKRDA